MRRLSSFAIVVGLILAVTGFGVWAASRTTHHAKVAGAKGVYVEDPRDGAIPAGGLSVTPPIH
jgi:hypothetical protein